MKFLTVLLGVSIGLIGFAQASGAADLSATTDEADGEALLRQLWAEIKEGSDVTIDKWVATGFQSVHWDGARDRGEEIALLKEVKIERFTLKDVRITRNGPVIVATYLAKVEEPFGGKRTYRKATPRMSVFLKTDCGWQLMAHANLNAPPKK